ncbi:hypothetical protein BLA15816_04200 [Burkholderia lata]|nr:hypothetical protein BLA15816_04200 [Burkholderia lata]
MFVPDGLALTDYSMHSAHDASQMHPVQAGVLDNERVAGSGVDGKMKCHIGLNHGLDVLAIRKLPSVRDESLVELHVPPGRKAGGKAI